MALLDVPAAHEAPSAPDARRDTDGPTTDGAARRGELFGRCRRCAGAVFASATRCHHCGFDVAGHNRRRLVYGAVGTLLALTVVLAPVGLPLLWFARYHRRQAERGVVEGGTRTRPGFLRRLLARQLAVAEDRDRPGRTARDGARAGHGFPPEL